MWFKSHDKSDYIARHSELGDSKRPTIVITNKIQAAPLLATGAVLMGVLYATPVAAAPYCAKTSPTTTQCETNGSIQIHTQPRLVTVDPGWPWWTTGWGGP